MRYQTPAEALEKLSALRSGHETLVRSAQQRGDTQATDNLQAKLDDIDEKIRQLREADVAPELPADK